METLLMAMHSDVEIEVDLAVDGEEGGCENINVDEIYYGSSSHDKLLCL